MLCQPSSISATTELALDTCLAAFGIFPRGSIQHPSKESMTKRDTGCSSVRGTEYLPLPTATEYVSIVFSSLGQHPAFHTLWGRVCGTAVECRARQCHVGDPLAHLEGCQAPLTRMRKIGNRLGPTHGSSHAGVPEACQIFIACGLTCRAKSGAAIKLCRTRLDIQPLFDDITSL